MQNYKSNMTPYNNYRQPIPHMSENVRKDVCDIKDKVDTLRDLPIAMAYVPWQRWQNIYDAEKGFCNGTIFQELNLPFEGMGGCQR